MSDLKCDVALRALRIAKELVQAESGERAVARRMEAEGAPVFWRMASRFRIGRNEEEEWRRITKALALLTPANAAESIHEEGRDFGAVLADGGAVHDRLQRPFYSEQRLARLLAARGAARLDALERAVRMLARVRPRVDVPSLARAYLNVDSQMIARAYYRRLDRRQESSQEGQSDA